MTPISTIPTRTKAVHSDFVLTFWSEKGASVFFYFFHPSGFCRLVAAVYCAVSWCPLPPYCPHSLCLSRCPYTLIRGLESITIMLGTWRGVTDVGNRCLFPSSPFWVCVVTWVLSLYPPRHACLLAPCRTLCPVHRAPGLSEGGLGSSLFV